MIIRRPSAATLVAILVTIAIATQTGIAAHAAPARTTKSYTTSRYERGDTSAPQRIRKLDVRATSASSVSVAWSRSKDNVAVTGYDVLVNGGQYAKTPATSYTIQLLACGTGYLVGVDAYDAAGNKSAPTSATVSTSPCADVTAPSTPSDIKLMAATDTSVVLSWTPSTDDVGVVEYGLYLSGLLPGPGLLVGRVSEASATVSNLECGKTYSLGIDAADAAGNRSTPGAAIFTTAACVDKTPPSAPTGLVVASATQDQIAVKWTASTDNVGVTGYGRYLAANRVGTATDTSSTFDSLQCGTTYTFGVDAIDAAGNRSAMSTMSAATAPCSQTSPPPTGDTSAPSAPQALSVTSATQTAVTIGWGPATDNVGVVNYRVYRDGTLIGEGPGSSGGYDNVWADSGRTCGTSYQYAVEAQDAAGNTGPKATVTASTTPCTVADTSAPTTPGNVVASNRTATSITLNWSASNDNVGVVSYGLYQGGTRVATPSGTTGIVSGLSCGTSYTLGVDAADAAGNRSSQAVVMVSTTACSDTQAPSTPTGVTASNITQTGATVKWNASSDNVGVTGYDVYRNGSKLTTVTGLTSDQAGLSCGTGYTFAVAARDAVGNQSPQAQVVVTTAACAPSTPTGTNVIELSGTVSSSQLLAAIAAKPAGPLTVRPAAGQTSFTVSDGFTLNRADVTITGARLNGVLDFDPGSSGSKLINSNVSGGFNVWGADNIVIEGNTLDGQGDVTSNQLWDNPAGNGASGFTIKNNSFSNYRGGDCSVHGEGLFIGGYSANGLVEGNTFSNNGCTSHIFFSYFGTAGMSGYSSAQLPRNICVRGNTFGPRFLNTYYDVNFRQEIAAAGPAATGIKVEPDAVSTNPEFNADC